MVVTLILNFDQFAENPLPINPLPALERQQEPVVRLRGTQTINARDTGHYEDVTPLKEGPRGRKPHPIDLVVNSRFLLDVRIC